MRTVKATWLLILIIVSFSLSASDREGELEIVISASGIELRGVTPGAEALVFTCGIASYNGEPFLRKTHVVLRDDDNDARITRETAELPPHVIVFAADLVNGNVGVRSKGFELVDLGVSERDIKKIDSDDVLEIFEDYVHVIAIRPGEDDWFASVHDGGVLDDDKKPEGKIRLKTKSLSSRRNGSKAPLRLKNGDVLFVVDPRNLEYSIVRRSE